MKLPGFNAEASINRSGRDYVKETIHEFTTSSVVPQAKALAKCNARCLGGYIGSAGACFVAGDPDLCFSLAGQRYNRCGDMCDLLYG